MPKDRYQHKGSVGYRTSQVLPVSDSLVTAVLGADYATPLDRSWKQPGHQSASVAAVSEARRLDRLRVPLQEISAALDGHGVKHSMGQLQRWLSGATAMKGYPIVRATDEPYLITPAETYEMNKRIALMHRMLEDEGLTLIKFADKKDNRITVYASAGTDEQRIFSLSQKEGDFRGDKNERARMRQFARECGLPETQLAAKLKPVVEEFKKVAAVAPPNHTARTDEAQSISDTHWIPLTPTEIETNATQAVTDIELAHEREPMPTTTPAPAKKAVTKGKKPSINITRLSMAEQYRLIEWLKMQKGDDFASVRALHIAASKALILTIPLYTMENAMKIAGIVIKPAKRDYVRAAPIIARAVIRLYEELGLTPDEELLHVAQES
jgi:hypothetical protein